MTVGRDVVPSCRSRLWYFLSPLDGASVRAQASMLNMQVQEKRRRGGYHQEDVKYASTQKEQKGRPNKRWQDNIRDDMKEYNVTGDMTQNRNVWHIKTQAGPLLAYIT